MEKNTSVKSAFFNITKYTALYWVLLVAVSAGALALEMCRVHQLTGLASTAFWQNSIAPFCRELELNFINLYISQISTTFLVTAFLSFLGGKEDPIYWTSAMEYKLINPKGTSLRDITWYCLGTLITSLVAVFFRAKLMFLLSFGVNLVGLSMITCRMILAFFARAEIKRQLQQEFLKADPFRQSEMLDQMEEHIVRAAHNHDVGYLRECVEFFRFLEEREDVELTHTYFERLRWFFQIIPDQLADVRWSIFVRLTNLLSIGDAVSDNKYGKPGRSATTAFPSLEDLQAQQAQLEQALQEKKALLAETKRKKTMAALRQDIALLEKKLRRLSIAKRPYLRATSPEKDNRRKLQDDVLRMLHSNLRTKALTERDTARWCDAAVALSRRNIAELFALASTKQTKRLNFQRDFKDFVYLLKAAYDNNCLLDDYMFSLQSLHTFVDYSKKEGCSALCYVWKDIFLLFQCVCDENALIERDRADFLLHTLQYTPIFDVGQMAQLQRIMDNCSLLSESSKEAILLAMHYANE